MSQLDALARPQATVGPSTRTKRFRAACTALAVLFLLIATLRVAFVGVVVADPVVASTLVQCVEGCQLQARPGYYLGSERARELARKRGATDAQIQDRLLTPEVKRMIVSAELIKALPLFAMFLALAAAMRCLAKAGLTGRVMRVLRHAAVALLVWSLLRPIAESIQWTAFSQILVGRETMHIVFGSDVLWPLLLSATAWIALRVLQEGVDLRRELEEYV